MVSAEQTDLRELVVKACATSVTAVRSGLDRDSSRCVISEPYFIKWGYSALHHTATTQKYVYDQAAQDPDAPRVPKVYDCFDRDRITYLVMEHIQVSSPQDVAHLHRLVANAIDWLLHLPAPPGAGIGPLGGGYACHPLFQDWTAPLRFSSNEALEIYLNKALDRLPRGRGTLSLIQIKDEPLVFMQSDIHEGNFILDPTGRLCLVDFNSVGLLPKSFAVHAVKFPGKPFNKGIADHLPSWTSPNLASMARARYILVMIADPTLGLNERGERRRKVKRG